MWPESDARFSLNSIAKEDDYLLHVTKHSCPRYKSIIDAAEAQPHVQSMLDQIDSDLEKTLFPELRQKTGMLEASTKEMHELCNYLLWMISSGHELTFDLTKE